MNQIVLTIALCLASMIADASDWEAISFGDEVIVYVDNESIRFRGDTAKAWIQWAYTKPRDLTNSYPAKKFVLVKSLKIFKCADRSSTTIQSISYSDRDGSNVVDSNQTNEAIAQYSEVVPDTVGEEILNEVCQRKSAPKS